MTEEGELARELEQDTQAAAEALHAEARSPERTEFQGGEAWDSVCSRKRSRARTKESPVLCWEVLSAELP